VRTSRTHSASGERGAVVVLFALMVPLTLFPIGAIAVDIGFWYVNAKRAQTTADAAALAAAALIPNTASVEALGGEYVLRNMPNATYEVEYPYVPDSGPNWNVPQPDEVEVTVNHPAPTFFGRIFGVSGVSSTRRAVAEKWEEPGKMAIFAYNDRCESGNALEFNGSDVYINGYVHSNGQFRVDAGPSGQRTARSPETTASRASTRTSSTRSSERTCRLRGATTAQGPRAENRATSSRP
jgi:hypothetical protein